MKVRIPMTVAILYFFAAGAAPAQPRKKVLDGNEYDGSIQESAMERFEARGT